MCFMLYIYIYIYVFIYVDIYYIYSKENRSKKRHFCIKFLVIKINAAK